MAPEPTTAGQQAQQEDPDERQPGLGAGDAEVVEQAQAEKVPTMNTSLWAKLISLSTP